MTDFRGGSDPGTPPFAGQSFDGPLEQCQRRPSIVFEDEACLVVNKPPGLLTQPAFPNDDSLERWVREYLAPDSPLSVYLGTPHRLDRPVSGLLFWAKTPKAARRAARCFEQQRVAKEYWAIVEGSPTLVAGSVEPTVWSDWIGRDPTIAGRRIARDEPFEHSRHAVSTVRLEVAPKLPDRLHWLKLWPATGRTHQLRAQATARGLPIVGDRLYGSIEPFEPFAIALHARRLRIPHPLLDCPMEFEAPIPPTWQDWLTPA